MSKESDNGWVHPSSYSHVPSALPLAPVLKLSLSLLVVILLLLASGSVGLWHTRHVSVRAEPLRRVETVTSLPSIARSLVTISTTSGPRHGVVIRPGVAVAFGGPTSGPQLLATDPVFHLQWFRVNAALPVAPIAPWHYFDTVDIVSPAPYARGRSAMNAPTIRRFGPLAIHVETERRTPKAPRGSVAVHDNALVAVATTRGQFLPATLLTRLSDITLEGSRCHAAVAIQVRVHQGGGLDVQSGSGLPVGSLIMSVNGRTLDTLAAWRTFLYFSPGGTPLQLGVANGHTLHRKFLVTTCAAPLH